MIKKTSQREIQSRVSNLIYLCNMAMEEDRQADAKRFLESAYSAYYTHIAGRDPHQISQNLEKIAKKYSEKYPHDTTFEKFLKTRSNSF